MNHLLLLRDELQDDPGAPTPDTATRARTGRATVLGVRAEHIRKILKLAPGDSLKVGVFGDGRGTGRITGIDRNQVELLYALDEPAPPRLSLDLVVALPRPKFIGRILQMAACFGVERLTFLHTERVEKSYWQSGVLTPQSVARHFHLGLEQGRDTIAPRFELARSFAAFVADDLPTRLLSHPAWLLHGEAKEHAPARGALPATLIVGPEGGLLDHEVERLARAGARPYRLGERPLRVEVAIAAVLSRFV